MAAGDQAGGPALARNPLRPYAVQPDFESAFEVPLRPISRPAAHAPRRVSTTSAAGGMRVGGPSTLEPSIEVDPNDSPGLLRGITAAGMISFASTALVMPFDVGKTLLQVQWIPKEDVAVAEFEPDQRDFGAQDDELSDEAEAEAYFADLTSRPHTYTLDDGSLADARQRHRRDRQGYIQRHSVFDESTKPEYVVPVVVTGGVWEMIKTLVKSKNEGITSLWKGQTITFISDSLETLLRPLISTMLTSTLMPTVAGLTILESPRPLVSLGLETLARVITDVVLSPLDLIRTRIVVQSSVPRFRKYRGPLHALRLLLEEEGGLRTLYLHANLLVPTIIDCTTRSIVHLGTPLFIERLFRVRSQHRPWTYALVEFALGTAGLCVVLPFETVRRRLQIQSRATTQSRGRPYRACIETRPVPYAGVVDAIYRIIVEETRSVPPQIAARKGKSRKDPPATVTQARAAGLGQLFRGFQVGVAANVLMLILSGLGERSEQ